MTCSITDSSIFPPTLTVNTFRSACNYALAFATITDVILNEIYHETCKLCTWTARKIPYPAISHPYFSKILHSRLYFLSVFSPPPSSEFFLFKRIPGLKETLCITADTLIDQLYDIYECSLLGEMGFLV